MPPATSQNGPELAIVLDNETAFKGGDTISGYIIRDSHFVDPNVSIKISLYARAEARLLFNHGMARTVYYTSFNLFDGPNKARKIYQGPIHIPPNSPKQGRWPFVIQIPLYPDLASLRRNNKDEKSFLPLDDISTHTLPPTFSFKVSASGRSVNAYIEYYLEATLVGDSKKQYQAIYPLYIWSMSPPKPIADFDIKHHSSIIYRIASQQLVLGIENTQLSLGQKIKGIFSSSQIPNYLFTLQQDFASILQIGNLNTIPLLLYTSPYWEGTSEVLQNVLQVIIVKHFTLTLLSTTYYCSKRLYKGERSDTKTIILADYKKKPLPKEPIDRGTHGEMSPSTDTLFVPNDSSAPPLDLGTVLGIKVPSISSRTDLYPTFTTYNLKNEHYLVWKLFLTVAGKTIRYDGKQPVIVIGQSYEHPI